MVDSEEIKYSFADADACPSHPIYGRTRKEGSSDIINYYPAHKMEEPNLLSPHMFDVRNRIILGGNLWQMRGLRRDWNYNGQGEPEYKDGVKKFF